ncbi:MAG: DUF1868 domain-containing protein [Rhodobacteraceae bacterium]|nr:DUF1868 domain-containing protein [Paracoccaceae bacterium]
MRDTDRALRYLTGTLTGGERPDAVGLKFTPDGRARTCPGTTTICHVDPASDAFAALVAAQDRLKAGPLAPAFTFLPKASLHMTIFEGVIDHARTKDNWPGHLALDATVAQVASDARERLRGLDLGTAFILRPVEVFGGFSVRMAGATEAEEARLRQARDRLRAALNLHRPDHDAYMFHITLAYLLRWLTADEARQVIELAADVTATLLVQMPHLTLGPIELCRFETMHHFEPMLRLER